MATYKIVLFWSAVAVGMFFLLQAMNESDKRTREGMAKIQACIDRVAAEEGYTGNTRGLEAYQLFAMGCIK